jgi:hypothetical protein
MVKSGVVDVFSKKSHELLENTLIGKRAHVTLLEYITDLLVKP